MRPPGRTAEDASIEAFKTENRERLFAFSIPQPPGDPKLLEVPVDLSNAKMDFAPKVAKKIGHLGLELLKAKHVQSGLQRRAELPAVNLGEGLKVLGLVPYGLKASGGGVPTPSLDKGDLEILDKRKRFLGQGEGMLETRVEGKGEGISAGDMSWVMNTTYINTADFAKARRREGTTAQDRDEMAEGSSTDRIDREFEAVLKDPVHPKARGLKAVESLPIVPYNLGEYGAYNEVHVNDADPFGERGDVQGSALAQVVFNDSESGETVEVALVMKAEGGKEDVGGGFTREKCEVLGRYKWALPDSAGRDYILMMGKDNVEYVDVGNKIVLSKFMGKSKKFNKELSRVSRNMTLKRKR